MTAHFFRSCLAVIAALALMLVSSLSLAGLELPPRNLNAAKPLPPVPARVAPASINDKKPPQQIDVLEQRFVLDSKPPQQTVFGFGVTSPGGVDVTIDWEGAPITVALRNQAGQIVASSQANSRSAAINYTLTPQDVAKGYLWTVVISGASPASGTARVTYPKADQALLNQYMANYNNRIDMSYKQLMTQVGARLAAQTTSKLQALQKAKQESVMAGANRIRSLANSGVQKKQAVLNAPLRPAKTMQFAQARINHNVNLSGPAMLSGPASSGAPNPTDPFVNAMAPDVASPGALLTVDGVNFKADDQVFFIINSLESQGQRTFLSSNKFQVKVPNYSSNTDVTGFFYIKANKNGQMVRIDSVVEIPFKATIPTIKAITTADPNGSGPARPNAQVLIAGIGFTSTDKIHFVINNQDLVASIVNSYLNTDDQVVVTIPDSSGFANEIKVPVYIENVQGNKGPLFTMTLAPQLESIALSMHIFNDNEIGDAMKQDRGFFDFSGCSNHWDDNWLHCRTNSSQVWGGKRDEIFLRDVQLKNNWVVKDILFQTYIYSPLPVPNPIKAEATIVESRIGSSSLYLKVHWWDEPNWALAYLFTYLIEGPKGTAYK